MGSRRVCFCVGFEQVMVVSPLSDISLLSCHWFLIARLLQDVTVNGEKNVMLKKKAGLLTEIALMVFCAFAVRSTLAATFVVPSGSMEPSLMIGDRIVTMNFAYGLSSAQLPFATAPGEHDALSRRLFGRLPARGDVVVFRAPANHREHWVKRVIALPGDRIALEHGRVWLNGRELPWRDRGVGTEILGDGRRAEVERYDEILPNGVTHVLFKRLDDGPLDNLSSFTVPAGHVFVMGDNRDNSADSRVPVAQGGVGLLPVWNLEGHVMARLMGWHDGGPDFGRFGRP